MMIQEKPLAESTFDEGYVVGFIVDKIGIPTKEQGIKSWEITQLRDLNKFCKPYPVVIP